MSAWQMSYSASDARLGLVHPIRRTGSSNLYLHFYRKPERASREIVDALSFEKIELGSG